jgi:exodeoxyribonuclease-5
MESVMGKEGNPIDAHTFDNFEIARDRSKKVISEDIRLSDDQNTVYKGMVDWVKNPAGVLKVGGYAGTGKTTLLAKLIQDFGEHRFVCATFTGRAANVLAQKIGVSSVQTIHRTIYRPTENRDGTTRFELREDWSPGEKIFVIDEASMVSEDLLSDIMAFGMPILAVGDHGQLPPIDGFSVLMDNPDLRLEKIHRQAEGSPIIELSRLIREKGRVPIPPPKGIRHLSWGAFKEELADNFARASDEDMHDQVVLTYKNSTRTKVNMLAREARYGEASNDRPHVGDMVVCLRNMPPIFNGMRGTLKRIGKRYQYGAELEVSYPDDGILHSGPVVYKQFGRETTFSSLEDLRKEKIVVGRDVRAAGAFYDYGYALTVHKAQGSGFRKVYWIRERGRGTEEDFMKWCYTAVTRASEELTIVAV